MHARESPRRPRSESGALEVAQLAPAHQYRAGSRDEIAHPRVAAQCDVILDPAGPVVAGGPQLVGVDPGMHVDLRHAGSELEQRSLEVTTRAGTTCHQMVGEHRALFGGETTERESSDPFRGRVTEPQR